MSQDKQTSVLSIIARVAAGKTPSDRTDGTNRLLAKLRDEISEPVLIHLATDIIAHNECNPNAKRYLQWARSIRRGAGNSQREREKVLALSAVESFHKLDKEVRRLHNIGATHRKRGFKLNDTTCEKTASRLIDEANEIHSEYILPDKDQDEARKLEETADLILILLHHIQMNNWTINDVVERGFEKLKDIFPDGYAEL